MVHNRLIGPDGTEGNLGYRGERLSLTLSTARFAPISHREIFSRQVMSILFILSPTNNVHIPNHLIDKPHTNSKRSIYYRIRQFNSTCSDQTSQLSHSTCERDFYSLISLSQQMLSDVMWRTMTSEASLAQINCH